jgi:GDP/UDP-N,N'-diacetylbacillosamine 2-epimerase (hydrolysing)
MKKVCVLTGTRAEYGLLKPIIERIDSDKELKLSLLVAGMHLSKEFGNTIDEIKEEGFKIDGTIDMNPKEDKSYAMAFAIGEGIQKITSFFEKTKPDILLILGDRIEALAAAIAAAYCNIAIAHIHGGDTTKAGLDESARHAITKFAHIHFPATKKSAERIKKLGEDVSRIFVSGAPCLDTILNKNLFDKQELEKKLKIELQKPFILLVQHSVTTEPEDAGKQIRETLEAIKELKYQTIAIYPNSDTGGREIIRKIDEYSKKFSFIKNFKSLSHKEYLSLMKYANIMIGNSSSGIIESSSFKLPVINIGIRQEGRERTDNVIDVKPDKQQILSAVKKALSNEFKELISNCRNPYGNGKAAEIIVNTLSKIKIDKNLLQKKITY